MGWYIALGLLVLLAVLPLGIHIRYDEDGAAGQLVLGPVKLQLFPKPKKQKKKKAQKPAPKKETPGKQPALQTAAQTAPDAGKAAKPAKKGGSVLDFLPLVKVVLNFLGDFPGILRVDVLEVKVTLAGGDPCDLAVNYGRAWAALGNLLPRLEKVLVIKKRDLNIQCDFEGSETLVLARVQITITLARLLGLVFLYLIRALIVLIPIIHKRKGGKAV